MASFEWPPTGGSGSSGIPIYANFAALPSGQPVGTQGVTSDTDTIYIYNGSAWVAVATPGDTAITLTGDVTGGGTGTVATSLVATTNSTLTSLANLATVGTLTTGGWNATPVTTLYGGTGLTSSGTSGNILTSNGSSWVSQAPIESTFTAGSVIFSNGTTLAQNNADLFWDNSNNRLGIGTNTPSVELEVYSGTGIGASPVLIHGGGDSNNGQQLILTNDGASLSLTLNSNGSITSNNTSPMLLNSAGGINLKAAASSNILFEQNNVIKAGIDTSGNFKIGNITATALLDVNGSARIRGLAAIGAVLNDASGNLSTLAPGTSGNVLTSNGTNWTSAAPATSGTVTSVGMTVPSILSVTPATITSSGTFAVSLATETANTVFAGPTSGSAATPTFRSLVGTDLPNPSSSTLGGIESLAAVTSKWINTISTSGVPSATQPAFTDISGSITASQISSQGLQNIYTSSTTYTTPASSSTSTIYEYVVQGAGGGGGGANGSAAIGGGGGSGGTARGTFTGISAGTVLTITIGASGVAGSTSGGNGGTGGTSSISGTGLTTITTPGGNGGTGTTLTVSGVAAGGTGGTVTGSYPLAINGNPGQPGIVAAGSFLISGVGGISPFGQGGASAVSSGSAIAFTPANGYGSGGPGAYGTSTAGGAGTQGLVIITQLTP